MTKVPPRFDEIFNAFMVGAGTQSLSRDFKIDRLWVEEILRFALKLQQREQEIRDHDEL